MTTSTSNVASSYVSTIGGLAVGWDVCGACHRHVLTCTCETGPSEPGFLAAERTGQDPPIAPASSVEGAAA